MNHRFIINIDLPEGVTWTATGRPVTRDQIEAMAGASLRERIIDQCDTPGISWAALSFVTEAAPAREEGGAK